MFKNKGSFYLHCGMFMVSHTKILRKPFCEPSRACLKGMKRDKASTLSETIVADKAALLLTPPHNRFPNESVKTLIVMDRPYTLSDVSLKFGSSPLPRTSPIQTFISPLLNPVSPDGNQEIPLFRGLCWLV